MKHKLAFKTPGGGVLVTITTDNAAFHDLEGNHSPEAELMRISDKYQKRFLSGEDDITILDVNGNKVGVYTGSDHG